MMKKMNRNFLMITCLILTGIVLSLNLVCASSDFVLDDFEDNDIFGDWDSPAGNVNWGPNLIASRTDLMCYEDSSIKHSGSYSMQVQKLQPGFPSIWIRDWEEARITNQQLLSYSHFTMWVYDNDSVQEEFILQSKTSSAYDQRAYTSGKGWTRLSFSFGPDYIFPLNEIHIVPGGGAYTATYYIDDVILTNCTCSSGACCDGCNFKDATTVCKENIAQEYGCPWGNNLGDDVGVKQNSRYCSGTSSDCNGIIAWSAWQVQDTCTADEICREGYPSCTEPDYTCYFDRECGENTWIDQSFCQDSNVYQDLNSYKCDNPGTDSSSCSNTIQTTLKERCLHGCDNNNCIISNQPPYLFPDQSNFLEDIFEQHLNYFLSNEPITAYGLPLTAYKVGDRARYGYSNPTEWGYLLQAWIAAAEYGVITEEEAKSRIETALTTMDALQNNPDESYFGLFYPYYKVTNSAGNDIFPYHDSDTMIPSIDNGLLYTSLLIVEGWSYKNNFSDMANLSKSIKDRMDYSVFLFDSDRKVSHQINATNNQLNTDNWWSIYPDEGGLMAFIMYISGTVDKQGYETLTDNQRREQREWNGNVVNEAALFNAMFTWSVRSLAGFKVTNTPYSTDSFVPAVKAHLEYGDFLNIDYPGFSDAMTQAYHNKSLKGVYFPPNLDNVVPATPPSHVLPHAFFVPFNVLADLNQTVISSLIDKINLLMNDSENYYWNTGTYNFGFTVTASAYRNDSSFTGADEGENVFETLSDSYIALSLFNALQNNNNNNDFYDLAANVPGYKEKVSYALNFLYPEWQACEDNDGDEFNSTGGDCGPVDCNDNNADIYPGAAEFCNGVDDNCDNEIDEELIQTCGSGDCLGEKICSAGVWNDCNSQGKDAGVCAKCNVGGIPVYDSTQNIDCNDALYCNGVETCSAIYTCQQGAAIDCSSKNLNMIETCNNDPDSNPFTWDYFAGFTSACNEVDDKCDDGTINLTHTCDLTCGAECVSNGDCNDNNPLTNDACLNNCTCYNEESEECVVPYSDMLIVNDTTFCNGTYNLTGGIDVFADDIVLDCNGAVLNGLGSESVGIGIGYRKKVVVKNCIITNYRLGIELENCNNNTIMFNTISNNSRGIFLEHSENNTLEYNYLYLNPGEGIMIWESNNNNILHNNASNNTYGILIDYSNNNKVESNVFYSNVIHGIYMYSSNNNKFKFNDVSNNQYGFIISSSYQNEISTNDACMNRDYDIYAENNGNNSGIDNKCDLVNGWNDTGASGCTNHCINCIDDDGDKFNVTGRHCGPVDCNDNSNLVYPDAVEICNDGLDNNCNNRTDNDDFDCMYGCVTPYADISITRSAVFCGRRYYINNINIIKDNIVVDCNDSYLSPGWGTGTVFNVLNRNNVTLKNCRIDPSWMGVLLSNSSDSLISNISCWGTNYCIYLTAGSNKNKISNVYVGKTFDSSLTIYDSSGNIVKDNKLGSSEYGASVRMYYAYNNIIENNDMSYNGYSGTWYFKGGAFLYYSNNNTIFNNTITNNKWNGHGVYLTNSKDNLISYNTVANNSEGFYLESSANNTIYSNNIENNTIQASDDKNNYWDYNNEGNYWSDYNEESEGCYDLNLDGFCDLPYNIIGGDSKDNYPFAKQAEEGTFWCNGSDINQDGVVDANDYDVIDKWYLFQGNWGGCNEATRWCNNSDITGPEGVRDGVIDANDYDVIDKWYLFQGNWGGCSGIKTIITEAITTRTEAEPIIKTKTTIQQNSVPIKLTPEKTITHANVKATKTSEKKIQIIKKNTIAVSQAKKGKLQSAISGLYNKIKGKK